jgi:DNA-binding NarL/FixJ family response regulator
MWQATALGAPGLVPNPTPRFAVDERSGGTPRAALQPPILVVEDDFLVAMQVEAALTEAGYALLGTAAAGEEALDIVATTRPGLVLMDIRLAGTMDGVEAALELFRRYGIRCIFATAHQDPEVRRRAAPAKPLAWLGKPYSMPTLLEAVRQGFADLDSQSR